MTEVRALKIGDAFEVGVPDDEPGEGACLVDDERVTLEDIEVEEEEGKVDKELKIVPRS